MDQKIGFETSVYLCVLRFMLMSVTLIYLWCAMFPG